MILCGVPLQVIGLIVDVAGAGIIALPDIPIVSKYLRSGKLREGKANLETSGLSSEMTGFNAILHEIESEKDEEIEEEPNKMTVYNSTVSAGGRNTRKVRGFYGEDDDGEPDTRNLSNTRYRELEVHLRNQIQWSESKVRLFGFAVLATGFIIQIIANVY